MLEEHFSAIFTAKWERINRTARHISTRATASWTLMGRKNKSHTLTGIWRCLVLTLRALNLSGSFGQSARFLENRCVVSLYKCHISRYVNTSARIFHTFSPVHSNCVLLEEYSIPFPIKCEWYSFYVMCYVLRVFVLGTLHLWSSCNTKMHNATITLLISWQSVSISTHKLCKISLSH